jgi:predicted dehydrogenase
VSSAKNEPIRIGIAGLGRSGWDIHIAALKHMSDKFCITAVVDNLAERRQQAVEELGCRAYETFQELLADPQIELVIVAMPTDLHASWTIQALQAGKDVVVEKPLSRDLAECDQVIAAAAETGKSVTVFQNRRYEPLFLKMKEIVDSGALGQVNFIRTAACSFKRRWDWQTLKKCGGGMMRNHGVHALDMMMEFAGEGHPEIFCTMDQVLASGDAEDWVHLVLRAPDWPLMEMDIFMNSAFPMPSWTILGNRGSLVAHESPKEKTLTWKTVKDFDSLSPHQAIPGPVSDRSYSQEKLEFDEHTWTAENHKDKKRAPVDKEGFYNGVFANLRQGAPQAITLESVRRRTELIDECLSKFGV